jgi:type II restriction/modification system DNA methylase subunit YeeA
MNTNNIKKYAPIARRDFIEAVGKRLNQFGVYNKGNALTISKPTVSGSVMQIDGNAFDAGLAPARKRLVLRAEQLGFDALVEQVAYTWFNRLCAIRFMELKPDYLEHGFRVLSHPEKTNSFEILDHAQDVAEALGLERNHIVELKLAGNKDEALYRELLLGQCHQLHQAMPFLFEALDDETELLLPDNLTRTDSILRGLVDGIPEEDWEQVEIIGWLYQFYISEKKDQVIGKVVKSEDIPAATQLFTPNWIVKYLVQNSVGRQWMMTYPDSGLKAQMDYYITPAEQEVYVTAALAAITPTSIEPETIKVIDPACGSGHILVEAYNLLKAIYEERGYRSRDIPKLILENNLYGLDIDDRAAQLAGFALMMKAREDDRRIFTRDIKLNVLALQSSKDLDVPYLWRRLDVNNVLSLGTNESLFDDDQSHLVDVLNDADFKTLQSVIDLFEHAKTFGSLIQVPADQADFLKDLNKQLQTLIDIGNTFQKPAAKTLMPFVHQAQILAMKFDAVIANPPYMGNKYLNPLLKDYLKKHYKEFEKDLFSASMIRNLAFSKETAQLGFMTPFVWMFISSYENLRNKFIEEATITSLIQPELHAFFDSAFVSICCFTISATHFKNYESSFIRLTDFYGADLQPTKTLEAIKNPNCGWFYNAKPDDFKKISGSPIAYWVSDKVMHSFDGKKILDISISEGQNKTSDNARFVRLWWEINAHDIGRTRKWLPYAKGGDYRQWYGNLDYVVDWSDVARTHYRKDQSCRIIAEYLWYKPGVSWTLLTSSDQSFRFLPEDATFDMTGSSIFLTNDCDLSLVISLLNSCVASNFLRILNPTLALQIRDVRNIPIVELSQDKETIISTNGNNLIALSRDDWNFYETSFDYSGFHFENQFVSSTNGSTCNPEVSTQQTDTTDVGLRDKAANPTYNLSTIYEDWQTQNRQTIAEMQRLEQENNQLFIDAYALQDELDADVPLEQITLTVNPKYRYGGNLTDEQLAQRFQADTLAELISYAIGCMMGRYRLDKPGLIYAHAGNIDFDKIYHAVGANLFAQSTDVVTGRINSPLQFTPDDDGIIPLTDQDWFRDDATNRFRDFVRTVWGEDNLQANLTFVAESLCLASLTAKRGEQSLETIRRYLSNQFYKDHLKTYKKRPIYWLFSSGKQKAFEGLVYLHRYNDSTLPRMRTEYVTPLLGKYDAFADQLKKQLEDATTSEATLLKKELLALEKKQTELRAFDDNLKHYADRRIKLDLDDGVKVNYGKFGDLLAEVKAVTGGKE